MYVRAFNCGCRCVEVDVWDGPGNEPTVYHGYTLTSKILFVDVLRTIRSHGFSVSPFPIILSFETHCCVDGQDKMAQYIEGKERRIG
jgi:phosphatidylinositol phospholipase C delta